MWCLEHQFIIDGDIPKWVGLGCVRMVSGCESKRKPVSGILHGFCFKFLH